MGFQDDAQRNNRLIWAIVALAGLVVLFICGVAAVILFGRGGLLARSAAPTPTRGAIQLPTRPATAAPPTTAANATAPPIVATVTLPAAQPSATPVPPAATATLSPGSNVIARRVDRPFVIDGNLDEWGAFPSYSSAFRVYTIAGWDGTDDLSAFWRLAWDNDNLYIGAIVIDDIHVQTQTGNLIFRGDSLEMQIDADRPGDFGPGLSPDDYQIVFSPGDFAALPPSAFRFRGQPDGRMLDAPGHAIRVAAQRTSDGYALEAAVPWIDIGVRPQPNLVLGLALNANDNDTPNSARQEVMKSNVSTRTFANPNTWGTLTLE